MILSITLATLTFYTYQVQEGVQSILRFGGVCTEDDRHDASQSSQGQGVVLVFCLTESKVKCKPDNLIPACFEELTLSISHGVDSLNIPVPDCTKVHHHAGEEVLYLQPRLHTAGIDSSDLDVIVKHIDEQGLLKCSQMLCMSFVVVVPHYLLLVVAERGAE